MVKRKQSDEETCFLHDIMDNSILPKSGFRYLVALAPSYLSLVFNTASNHVIRNIYNTTKMSTKDSHFRRVWGKSIQLWCIDCIVGKIGLFCAETWKNLTERNVYILGPFVFKSSSMLVRKTWDTLHIKRYFSRISIISKCRQDSEVQNRMIFRDRNFLLLTLWQRPQEHFNRHPPF